MIATNKKISQQLHKQIHYIAGSTKHHRIEDMIVHHEGYCEVGNL
jgi:hypothetical protein